MLNDARTYRYEDAGQGDEMPRRIRAIAIVGGLWATTWALTGIVVNTWRFFLDAGHLGLERSTANLWQWAHVGFEVGGSCGFIAGATFGIMLSIVPPLATGRVSSRWSIAYGVTSGLAASAYILPIGYGTMMLPFFAGLFGLTGAATAFAVTAIAAREPIADLREESVA